MRKTILSLLLFVFAAIAAAQSPTSFNYQAVLRDDAGEPIAYEAVSVEIAILKGSLEGTEVFSEVHNTQTNEFGLINLQVGSVSSLEDIAWGEDLYFIRVSLDGDVMGASQLLNVPYALHAKTSADTFSGDYHDLDNLPELDHFIAVDSPGEGDMLVYTDAGWTTIPMGQEQQVLQIVDGMPQWADVDFGNGDDNGNGYQDGDTGTFVDPRDDQEYGWVVIGQQKWMSENLNFYTPGGSWYYDNDSLEYAESYARLYAWVIAMDGAESSNDNPSGVQGICPPGWHLPSDAEWDELIDFLDSDEPANLLKEEGTDHWNSTNDDVTNETGFTARPGGRRMTTGSYQSIGAFGLWWSTKERADSPDNAWTRYMLHNNANVTRFGSAKNVALSVRCIAD